MFQYVWYAWLRDNKKGYLGYKVFVSLIYDKRSNVLLIFR